MRSVRLWGCRASLRAQTATVHPFEEFCRFLWTGKRRGVRQCSSLVVGAFQVAECVTFRSGAEEDNSGCSSRSRLLSSLVKGSERTSGGHKIVGRWRAASSRAPPPPAVEGHRGQQAVSPERLGSGIGRRSSRNLWYCSTRTGHRQGRGLPASAYGVEKKGGLECFRDSHYNRAPTSW